MSRFRVFAGPNGSGKSTIISSVKGEMINGRPIDFGIYVNADDLAVTLETDRFSFNDYSLDNINNEEFQAMVVESGLINENFPLDEFKNCYKFIDNRIHLSGNNHRERMAQIVANFLVKRLINECKKCSMETVFSHDSKLDIMRSAANAGYKVYLYFVATANPEINLDRVALRVSKKGHDVPHDRIISRYYRSLDMLYDAAQIAYQCYFFDNSGNEHKLVAHFKMEDGRRVWDPVDTNDLPDWFIQYYINKQPQ